MTMSTTTDPAQQYGGDTIKRMRSSHSTSSAHLDRFSDEVKDDATEEAFCDKELSEPETVEGSRVATDQDNGDSEPELHDVHDSIHSTTDTPSRIMEMLELVDYIQEIVNERMSTTV